MNILINASNLSGGGGVQVADSFCRYLNDYPNHHFVIVLSSALEQTAKEISSYKNVEIVRYNYPAGDWKSFVTLRNATLDQLVDDYRVECVYTVFGPMKWKPRCRHICGFALSHLVMQESPYFRQMSIISQLGWKIRIKVWEFIFRRSSNVFITENPLITERLKKMFKRSEVYTITNNYNQIFDDEEKQQSIFLPHFDGVSILSIGTNYPHKNFGIIKDVAVILKQKYPKMIFRFVLTMKPEEYPGIGDDIRDCFVFLGKVDISQCPSLYKQVDIAFVPTLLECFTAAYPEAMRMCVPIVTTNLEFSKGLCESGAVYYEATNPDAAADALYKVINDDLLQKELIEKGKKELDRYDSSSIRVRKTLELCVGSVKID